MAFATTAEYRAKYDTDMPDEALAVWANVGIKFDDNAGREKQQVV